jgi:serine/threonine-protein kinase HipA
MTTQILEGPVQTADVYKAGKLAARLRKTSGGVEFSYLEDYLSSATGEDSAVATTLPLTEKPVWSPSGAVPPFFAGLLPEGRRLTSLRRRIKVSADDELSLLVAVGRDTVGDVQVLAAGEPLTNPAKAKELLNPQDISFFELVADEVPLDGVGLAGVQDKVSGKNIAVPVRHRSRDSILKLSPPEYPHLVENEAFFLSLAKRSGMPCVEHSVIFDRDGNSGLVVSRFDRRAASFDAENGFERLPVEDGAQVLGLWPADKYNPSMEKVIDALTEFCSARLVATQLAFQQVAFSILTGNGDLHAKNISIVKPAGEWVLAPAYDLPSTLFYGDSSMALSIGGKLRDVSRRQLVSFANSLSLPTKVAERTLDQLLDATADLESDLKSGTLPFDPSQVSRALASLSYRRRLLSS